MWTSTALLACLVALVTAHSLPDESDRYFQAPKDFLERQLQILKIVLLQFDSETYDSLSSIARSYRLEDNLEHFKDPEPARKFLFLEKTDGFFPRSDVFTLSEYRPREEAKMLFDMLFNAEDFNTFFQTAVYARERMNQGLFYYVFRTILGMREDTKYFYYPADYEIYPHAFLDARVIQKAKEATIRALKTGDFREVIIPANHVGNGSARSDSERVLSYMREDPGLNMLNVEFHSRFPAWFNSSRYGRHYDRKGELFLHFQRQLLARDFLERLSNNLGEVRYVRVEEPLGGYYSGLRHSTGVPVTPRQPFTKIRSTKQVSLSEYKENYQRIRDAIYFGFVFAENGTHISLRDERGLNILGETLAFVGDNINYEYYNSIYNQEMYLLGEGDSKIPPSALLLQMTALRDPLYYQNMRTFYNDYLYEYTKAFPRYTYDEVAFSGLTVESVDIDDKLVTYFDDFDISLRPVIGNGFKFEDNKVNTFARMKRLNHQPYSYRVSLTSDKATDVIVKVYITPKYDPQGNELRVSKRIFYSWEIDRFPAKVAPGKNVIQRNSHESTVAVDDPPTFTQMWNKVRNALNGNETLVVDKFARPHGFPQRLLLPRGNRYGLPVQFVVVVLPYVEADTTDHRAYDLQSVTLLGTPDGVKYPDPRPIAFPIDRPYRSEFDANTPNIFTKEVRIFHKSIEEIDLEKQ